MQAVDVNAKKKHVQPTTTSITIIAIVNAFKKHAHQDTFSIKINVNANVLRLTVLAITTLIQKVVDVYVNKNIVM